MFLFSVFTILTFIEVVIFIGRTNQILYFLLPVDGTDGKQARRTKSSSPLGELFDHGLDSWATLLMPVGIYSVFGRGDHSIPPERVFYVLASVMIMFLLSHWEKYNTGVLFLPWGYDVSQLVRWLFLQAVDDN